MKRALLLIVVSLWLSGCALTTEQIDLSYSSQSGVSTIPGAKAVIVSVQVNDQRQEKSNKVSCKKNGFGMEMAPIIANEDVTVTIRHAMEQELRARGFSIGNHAVVSILADLIRFWNDHKTGFFSGDAIADLNMTVSVKNKRGDILYSRQVVTQGVEPSTQLMNGNNARLALDRALENGMKLLFEDKAFIAALIKTSKKSTS